MPPRVSAFPKCYLDEIAAARTMSVFEWVEMARGLDADGLEMYEGFFTSLDSGYLGKLHDAIRTAGFEMPMLCCSPDFTNPSPDARKHAVEHEAEMIRVARVLGGPRTVCRVLTGQRYPEVSREQGIEWVAEAITALRYKPVSVDDPRSVARARWPAERIIILRAAEHVVERCRVVDRDVIELGHRKIRFEVPIATAIPALIDAAVAADKIMIIVCRIDPNLVIVDVL